MHTLRKQQLEQENSDIGAQEETKKHIHNTIDFARFLVLYFWRFWIHAYKSIWSYIFEMHIKNY